MTAIVKGEGTHAKARLKAYCRSERLLYLTFRRAIPELREAGEEASHRAVAFVETQRISDIEIGAVLEWKSPTKVGREECAARFTARLNTSEEVVVNHGPPSCTEGN
jgi:hypothetical protein